jgi:hypothetical protein
VAQITNVYRDVRVRIGGGAGCSTDRFAIRPTTITISALDLNWQQPYAGVGASRTLNTTAATGGVVHAASDPAATTPRPFTLTAAPQAAGGQSASRYDGTPTIAATFPACVAPPAACVTGTLSFTGGASWTGTGTRSNATAHYTEAGVFNLQLEDTSFASFDATDGSSAATRTVPATATVTVGRFVPDHFDLTTLNSPSFLTFNTTDTSCNAAASAPKRSFTYIGQGFGYASAATPSARIAAKNAGGTTTQNYKGTVALGGLWKIGAASPTVAKDCTTNPDLCQFTTTWPTGAGSVKEVYSYTVTPVSVAVANPNWENAIATGAAATVANNGNGTGDITFSTLGRLAFKRAAAAPQGRFTASIADTVSVQDDTEAGTATNGVIATVSSALFSSIPFDTANQFRYGIVRLVDVFGPLTGNSSGNAPVAIQTQYWDGTAFLNNAQDNCSSFIEKNFVLYGHSGAITTGNLATPTGASNGKVSMDGGSPATLLGGVARANVIAPTSPSLTTPGTAKICLDLDSGTQTDPNCIAPTPANQGYLQGRWSGATYANDPEARIGFGLFGAQPKNFIFFRENY